MEHLKLGTVWRQRSCLLFKNKDETIINAFSLSLFYSKAKFVESTVRTRMDHVSMEASWPVKGRNMPRKWHVNVHQTMKGGSLKTGLKIYQYNVFLSLSLSLSLSINQNVTSYSSIDICLLDMCILISGYKNLWYNFKFLGTWSTQLWHH